MPDSRMTKPMNTDNMMNVKLQPHARLLSKASTALAAELTLSRAWHSKFCRLGKRRDDEDVKLSHSALSRGCIRFFRDHRSRRCALLSHY